MHEISCRMMQLFRRGMLMYIFFELKMLTWTRGFLLGRYSHVFPQFL